MNIGLMVEGQFGLTWQRWSHILALAERLEFPTLFRSDHYFIGTQQESLEPYLSFVVAAMETRRIRFGPLVSPVTFRRPVDVARMAAQLDVLSGGRFVMGLGAGWNQAEHHAYGIPFPPAAERMDRLDEAVNLMRTVWSQGKATYQGRFYQVEDVDCLPKPSPGGPPILIGGGGERRTLRMVAQYADEWNCTTLSTAEFARKKAVLAQHCQAVGRDVGSIRCSMMAFGIVGATQAALDQATERMIASRPPGQRRTLTEFREQARSRGMIVGQTQEVVEQLGRLAELGMNEVQFQHMEFDSDDVPEYLASEVAPKVAAL